MKDLRGKNAIVTGASRGLGVYIAKALAERGVNLALVARSADKLEDTRRICEASGVRVITIAADVTSVEDQHRLVATAEREFGSTDILINNAGIEIVCAFNDLKPGQIEDIIRTNLISAIRLTKLVLPSMLSRKSGAIVQVASMAGKSPIPYNTIYATTKAGLVNFAGSLHSELDGTGVVSSVVCPGFVADAGMWADHAAMGATLPRTLGTVSPQKVAAGVIKAIAGHPEVIVASGPMRPLLALGDLMPGLRFTVIRRLGVGKVFKVEADRVAAAMKGDAPRTAAESERAEATSDR
ncbi:MAG: SDR family NAD(P)-dependent oxidoreductase [Dehalococcoidia bacterium]